MSSYLFSSSIKYGMVVCPAINNIRKQKRTLLYDENDSRLPCVFASMMMEYGYIPSIQMFDDLHCMSSIDMMQIFALLKDTLEEVSGVRMASKARIFYENFPDVPFNLFEQRILAIAHYCSRGTFFPEDWDITQKEKKSTDINEKAVYKELSFVSSDDVVSFVYEKLLISSNTLPIDDINYVREVVKYTYNVEDKFYLENALKNITNKEILAYFVAEFVNAFNALTAIKHTIINGRKWYVTDVLRIATAMCYGDVSLAENTKFKLKKWQRKFLCEMLLSTDLSFEDTIVHKNKWVRLLHCLHVGDYSPKLFKWAMVVREKFKVETFNSVTEKMFNYLNNNKDTLEFIELTKHLSKRPSMFIRNFSRLGMLVDSIGDPRLFRHLKVAFEDSVNNSNVPRRVLYQLYSYILTGGVESRVFFPKGMKTKYFIKDELHSLPNVISKNKYSFMDIITERLKKDFSEMGPIGNVYIDDALFRSSINNGLRNVTPGKQIVSRGCKIPFSCNKTLRMFMYWIGRDLDLAASFMNKHFEKIGECSFRHTSMRGIAQHSGDIVNAPSPRGASEYIDIDIEKALESGIRYVGMHIYVYAGQKFSEMEACSVGWMERERPNSNEIYDPKTVRQKIDLTGESMSYTPVIFDLKEKTVCYVDMNYMGHSWGNSLGNRANQELHLMKNMLNKEALTLGDLIVLHILAREGSECVSSPEEADIVFGLEQGITPYDYLELEKWV